jgi:hypothetical protein
LRCGIKEDAERSDHREQSIHHSHASAESQDGQSPGAPQLALRLSKGLAFEMWDEQT